MNNSFDPNLFDDSPKNNGDGTNNQPPQENPVPPQQQVPPQQPFPPQNTTFNSSNPTNPMYDPNSYYTDYNQQPAAQPAHGLALTSLICSIIAFFCCGLPLGITAIICASLAKKQGNTEGIATAGFVCGIIAIVLAIITTILSIVLETWLAETTGNLLSSSAFIMHR